MSPAPSLCPRRAALRNRPSRGARTRISPLSAAIAAALSAAAPPAAADTTEQPRVAPEATSPSTLGSPAALRPGETAFDADSWRAYAGGRTVVYFDADGLLDGFERFDASGDRSEWRFVDGDCARGRWTEIGGVFCFDYPPGQFCYRHLRRDGAVWVRDARTGEEFRVEISDAPLTCPSEPVSQEPRAAPRLAGAPRNQELWP